MLFNNGMYREVVNVVHRRREEQLKNGTSTSRHQNCLLFAACYKLVSDKLCHNRFQQLIIIILCFCVHLTEYTQRF